MAKYKGRFAGKIRGQYERAILRSIQNTEEDNSLLQMKLTGFLGRRGYCTTDCENHNDVYTQLSSSYHMGGCTIGMEAMTYYKDVMGDGNMPDYYVDLRLVSNDSLQDIVDKILNEFPSFNRVSVS